VLVYSEGNSKKRKLAIKETTPKGDSRLYKNIKEQMSELSCFNHCFALTWLELAD
jgi:hypothetical protein